MIGNVVGSAGVGADVFHREHFQVLHVSSFALSRPRDVAAGAVFAEQCATFCGQGVVDGPQQFFGPGGRCESLQGFFDQMQITHPDAGRVTIIALERLPITVEEIQRGAYTQGFADIASHGLLRRAVPLHPVECPHIP